MWQYGPFFCADAPSAIVPPLTVAAQQRLPAMGQTFALHPGIIAIASGHPQRADDNGLRPNFIDVEQARFRGIRPHPCARVRTPGSQRTSYRIAAFRRSQRSIPTTCRLSGRHFLQTPPKGIFQTNARLMSTNDHRTLHDCRFCHVIFSHPELPNRRTRNCFHLVFACLQDMKMSPIRV